MRRIIFTMILGLLGAAPASAQVYATPLPPGPGTVPLVFPGGPLVAPILMPLNAPTAAPVAIYNYASPRPVLLTAGGSAPPTRRFYVGAEFLFGVVEGDHLPALVTASPAGTPIGQAGALFNPTTFTSFGGGRANNEFRPGARFHAGYWLDCEHVNAIELGGFFLGGTNDRFIGSSGPGGIILARPLVNGTTSTNFGLPVAGITPGGITASADSSVGGFDINYRRASVIDIGARLDAIAGFRFLHLGDSVDVWQANNGLLVNDHFSTRNNFYGGQIGGILTACMGGGFGFEGFAKVAIGVTAATADTDASTAALGQAVPIGVLVQPTNLVGRTTTYFGVVPEAGIKLNYAFGERFRVDAGYSFLYWSEVRRAPGQIDLTTTAPGRPAFRDETTDLWIQAFSLGARVEF